MRLKQELNLQVALDVQNAAEKSGARGQTRTRKAFYPP